MNSKLRKEISDRDFDVLEHLLDKFEPEYVDTNNMFISFTEGKILREGKVEVSYKEENFETEKRRKIILTRYMSNGKLTLGQIDQLSKLVINTSKEFRPYITDKQREEFSSMKDKVPNLLVYYFFLHINRVLQEMAKKWNYYRVSAFEFASGVNSAQGGDWNIGEKLANTIITLILQGISRDDLYQITTYMSFLLIIYCPFTTQSFLEKLTDPEKLLERIIPILRQEADKYVMYNASHELKYNSSILNINIVALMGKKDSYKEYLEDYLERYRVKEYLELKTISERNDELEREYIKNFMTLIDKQIDARCGEDKTVCINKLLLVVPPNINIEYYYGRVMDYVKSNQKFNIKEKLRYVADNNLLYTKYQIISSIDSIELNFYYNRIFGGIGMAETKIAETIKRKLKGFQYTMFDNTEYIISCIYLFFVILDERKQDVYERKDGIYGNFKLLLSNIFFNADNIYDVDMDSFMVEFILLKSKIRELFTTEETVNLGNILSYLFYDFIYMVNNYHIN